MGGSRQCVVIERWRGRDSSSRWGGGREGEGSHGDSGGTGRFLNHNLSFDALKHRTTPTVTSDDSRVGKLYLAKELVPNGSKVAVVVTFSRSYSVFVLKGWRSLTSLLVVPFNS